MLHKKHQVKRPAQYSNLLPRCEAMNKQANPKIKPERCHRFATHEYDGHVYCDYHTKAKVKADKEAGHVIDSGEDNAAGRAARDA